MSLTPSMPNLDKVKTFWQRPEGKTGALVIVASAIAGVYGFSLLLPWLIVLFQNTIYAAGLGIVLFALIYTITNKMFRSIVGNGFRLCMRWLTGMVVEIDPIGILKNNIDKMQEKKDELDKGIEGCAGAKKQLENQIAANNAAILHAQSLITECDKRVAVERNPMLVNQYNLRKRAQLEEVGRRNATNINYQRILGQTNKLYQMLIQWQQLAEYNIDNATAEMKNLDTERKTVLASYKAMGPAQRLIKGDPEQLKMVNAAIEYIAEDNANKLGAMEEFSRHSEKFLQEMDLEQGASAADAEKLLSEMQKSIDGGTTQAPALPAGSASGSLGAIAKVQAVPVSASKNTQEGDYLDQL